jgi:glycerol-3-phosphate dehydrogenase subunit C
MPLLEQGRIADVAANARAVAATMKDWIDRGYDVIALVPSCALMLKFEWPLILPGDPDVAALARSTFDISEYIVDIARKEGLAPGLAPMPATMTVHMACHARAQNMGQKAAEMLRLVPQASVKVIERCSGHGGSWGFKQEFFEVGMKVGRPVARQAAQNGAGFVMSECPLAGVHIQQGIERLGGDGPKPELVTHPIQILARAYEGTA